MRLIKLSFVETADLPDCYIRPYEANFRKEIGESFSKATEGASRISAESLAKVTHSMIAPSAGRAIQSNIDNGWGASRLMFAMVVEVAARGEDDRYLYIVGSTDQASYTTRRRKVSFDQEMRLNFNSITRVLMTQSMYRGDKVYVPKIETHDQVLNRRSIQNNQDAKRPATARPVDLFRRVSSTARFGGLLDSSGINGRDYTGGFTSPLVASSRVNNSPSHYLSRSLSAWIKKSADPNNNFHGDMDNEDIADDAVALVGENLLEDDPYISAIARDTNILRNGFITYGELMDLNPDYDDNRNTGLLRMSDRRVDRRADRNCWRAADNETIAAQIIANSLPGIMINSMYSIVKDIVINTRCRMGESPLQSAFPQPFIPGMSIRGNFPYFESKIVDVMLHEITHGGMFDVEAHINANIDTEIEITISIDGGEDRFYVFPVFADAMIAPTLQEDLDSLTHISDSCVRLGRYLSNDRLGKHPNHSDNSLIDTTLDISRARDGRSTKLKY